MRVFSQKRISIEWLILTTLVFIIAIIGFASWKRSTPGQKALTTLSPTVVIAQKREEADVAVSVEYIPQQANSDETTVVVALDTHSVNLDNVNFSRDVTVEKDGKVIKPIRIKEEGSGHHRKTQLTFPKTPLPFIIIVSNVSKVARREFPFE